MQYQMYYPRRECDSVEEYLPMLFNNFLCITDNVREPTSIIIKIMVGMVVKVVEHEAIVEALV